MCELRELKMPNRLPGVVIPPGEPPIQFVGKKKKTEKGPNRSFRIQSWELANYKNTDLLLRSISEQGKILPQTLTKAKLKQQRALARSVKQARVLGLLPFVHNAFDRTRL